MYRTRLRHHATIMRAAAGNGTSILERGSVGQVLGRKARGEQQQNPGIERQSREGITSAAESCAHMTAETKRQRPREQPTSHIAQRSCNTRRGDTGMWVGPSPAARQMTRGSACRQPAATAGGGDAGAASPKSAALGCADGGWGMGAASCCMTPLLLRLLSGLHRGSGSAAARSRLEPCRGVWGARLWAARGVGGGVSVRGGDRQSTYRRCLLGDACASSLRSCGV